MEAPKLIVTAYDHETPISGMCSVCRAIFPGLKGKGQDGNKRILEDCFRDHVNAEHSGINLRPGKANDTTCNKSNPCEATLENHSLKTSRETLRLYTPTEKLLASKDCLYRRQ